MGVFRWLHYSRKGLVLSAPRTSRAKVELFHVATLNKIKENACTGSLSSNVIFTLEFGRRIMYNLPSYSRLSIPHDQLIPLTERDKCKARELLDRPHIQSQEVWKQEVCDETPLHRRNKSTASWIKPDRCNPESFEFPPSPLTFSLFTKKQQQQQTNDPMWLFYHRLMLNTVLRHSNILASFKSRDNAILNVFIQYQWWFKSEFKGLWIKLTKRFLDLCFLLQIFDYCFFQIKTMLSLGFKAEIQALSSISFNFLSETYLPVKIKHGRWIWWLSLSSIFTHI